MHGKHYGKNEPHKSAATTAARTAATEANTRSHSPSSSRRRVIDHALELLTGMNRLSPRYIPETTRYLLGEAPRISRRNVHCFMTSPNELRSFPPSKRRRISKCCCSGKNGLDFCPSDPYCVDLYDTTHASTPLLNLSLGEEAVEMQRTLQKRRTVRPGSVETQLPSRDAFAAMLDDLHLAGPGIEIGVHSGKFAAHMLDGWKSCTAYHLIDPWADPGSNLNVEYTEFKQLRQDDIDARMHEAIARTRPWGDRVVIWRALSQNTESNFVDGSMAFVYIDGNHDYLPVVEDLRRYWPKVMPGGILAGHDHHWEDNHGVKVIEKAADEFANEYGLVKHITGINGTNEVCCPSFWFQKPLGLG